MKKSIIFLSLLMVVFWAPVVGASCQDPSDCYCSLKPDVSQALVRVEVKAVADGLADLEILGTAYFDPQNILGEESLLQGVEEGGQQFATGQIWLVRVVLEAEQLQIGIGVEEIDGLLPCYTDPDFPGATADTVAGAVLSRDCEGAVRDLGVWGECDMGCCASSIVAPSVMPNSAFWMFVLLALGFAGFRFGRSSRR